MKARAIVKIVVCSVLAVVLTTLLAAALFVGSVDFFEEDLSIHIPGMFPDTEDYTVGGGEITGQIRGLQISWASGQVVVKAYDGDTVRISEGLRSKMGGYAVTEEDIPGDYAPEKEEALRYDVKDGVLDIQAAKSGWNISIPAKVLLVLVPQGELSRLEINNASATVELEGLTVDTVELDTASGDIFVTDCVLGELEADSASGDCEITGEVERFAMNSASGDAHLTGEIERVEMDSASGSLIMVCETAPKEVEFSAVSGGADLTLPEESSFAASMDSVSGELNISGFQIFMEDGDCVVGSGTADYEFDTTSGDVIIRCGE